MVRFGDLAPDGSRSYRLPMQPVDLRQKGSIAGNATSNIANISTNGCHHGLVAVVIPGASYVLCLMRFLRVRWRAV